MSVRLVTAYGKKYMKKWELIQMSKEFLNGRWQNVGFYQSPTGKIKVEIIKKKARKQSVQPHNIQLTHQS